MNAASHLAPTLLHLNALIGGLFLLATLGLIATRQVLACLRLFVLQSLLLCGTALVHALPTGSGHLLTVAALVLLSRALIIPWLLGRTLHREVFTRREIVQALNIPTSLLIALALVLLALSPRTCPWAWPGCCSGLTASASGARPYRSSWASSPPRMASSSPASRSPAPCRSWSRSRPPSTC
jgi:hypothetical protein